MQVLGYFDSTLSVGKHKVADRLYVVAHHKTLLSRRACVGLGLVSYNTQLDCVTESADKFRNEFPSLFSGLGRMSQEAEIQVNTGSPLCYLCSAFCAVSIIK